MYFTMRLWKDFRGLEETFIDYSTLDWLFCGNSDDNAENNANNWMSGLCSFTGVFERPVKTLPGLYK